MWVLTVGMYRYRYLAVYRYSDIHMVLKPITDANTDVLATCQIKSSIIPSFKFSLVAIYDHACTITACCYAM